MNPFLTVASLLLFLWLAAPATLSAEVIDRVVASIGNDAVTLYDLEREGGPQLKDAASAPSSDERDSRSRRLQGEALDRLIEKVVLMREARRMEIEVGEEELNAAIESVKQDNKIGQEELVAALKREGLTFERYREELQGQMIRSRVIDRKVRGSIRIGDEEIRNYYDRNPERFAAGDEIRARHILFQVSAGADEVSVAAVRKKAEEVLEKVRAGGDFALLAERHSDGPSAAKGGDLGFFRREDMVKPFSDAAFALKTGEVSDLVLTPFGFHIIELLDRRGGEQLSFEAVKEKIRALLFSEELERGIKQFIDEVKERDEVAVLL